ncbi:MAG: hypothetical protein HY654_05610 [Acidobacteria bacterium]|nr:hypothetical protein [Acidobacteriota bacterium]
MALLGALGDIHGDLDTAWRIMRRHPDVPAWVCVGDLENDHVRTNPPPAPFFLTKGNNEDFDFLAQVARGDLVVANFAVLVNGLPATIAGCQVVALGGTLAPTWYDTRAADLPYPGAERPPRRPVRDDKRRHFVREEVEACKRLRGIDMLITHEAPRPYIVKGHDAGKTPVNEILASMKPRLHLFGHHHRFTEATRQGVRSIGLDLVGGSHLLIDTATWTYERVE